MLAKTLIQTAMFLALNVGAQGSFSWGSGPNSGTTNTLYSFHRPARYVNPYLAYAVGANGTIVKNPGYINLTLQNSGTSDALYSVYFVSDDTGYVVGGYIGGIDRSVILKTVNGGTNWIPQNGGVARVLRTVFFVDANLGFAAGAGGTILKTVNGGTAWIPQNSGTLNTLNNIQFTDAATGYAVGDGGIILKTTDGGVSWAPSNSGTTQPLNSLHFSSADTGYVAGGAGTIRKTVDAGTVWTSQNSGTTNTLNSIQTVYLASFNIRYGFAVGNSGIALICPRTNSNINWGQSFSPTTATLYSLHFNDGSGGIVVGANGIMLVSTWETGITLKHPGTTSRFSVLLFDTRGRVALKLFDGIAGAGEREVKPPSKQLPGPYFLDSRAKKDAAAR